MMFCCAEIEGIRLDAACAPSGCGRRPLLPPLPRFARMSLGTARRGKPRRLRLDALLEARADEVVEIAVQHGLRVAHFDVRAQILHAALVEHIGTDLVAPT